MTYVPPEEINPFRAPSARVGDHALHLDHADHGDAELIRRHHINHEASVKSVGQLYYLGAVFGGIGTIALLLMGSGVIPMNQPNQQEISPEITRWVFLGLGVFYLALTVLNGFLGYGLHHLQVWARWTVIVLMSLSLLYVLGVGVVLTITKPPAGLIFLALGGLIPGYIIYLMVSPKGSMVFSSEYKEIIRRTPHVKRKTSLILKMAVVLLVLVIVLIIVAAIMAPRS